MTRHWKQTAVTRQTVVISFQGVVSGETEETRKDSV